jgi:hypothetical protein
MNQVAEWIQKHEGKQDPLACDGCHSLRMFYAFGPFYIVQALIEALGDTHGLGEAEMRL